MALIQCSECHSEVSDKAASCPKCGAPVAAARRASGPACPFCHTSLNEGATVCPSCHAWYGYMSSGKPVDPKRARRVWLVALVISVVAFFLGTVNFAFGLFGVIVGGVSIMFLLYIQFMIMRGEKWWRRF